MRIYITAQAMQKRDIETKFAVKISDTVEHLFKLYLMPNHSSRNHWEGEIFGFIHKVEKLKRTNRYPSAQEIYKWTYDKVQDIVTDKKQMSIEIRDVCERYNMDITIPIEEIMNAFNELCVDYFHWLADRLSTDGSVTSRDVYAKLDSLV